MIELRLLGPLELPVDRTAVNPGPAKQRVLLAALAVDVAHPIAVDVLVDRIWDDAPPRNARRVLHTYVARLRQVLAHVQRQSGERVAVTRRPDGYQLVVEPDSIDLHEFRRLIE
jgi:DNA-binding SARP family transcriptional activator